MKKLRLVVLMGGNGAEREVSLSTGEEVVRNLDSAKYEVFSLDLNDAQGSSGGRNGLLGAVGQND